MVVKEDLTTPADPFDMGAGRVDVGRATTAPVTISETASNFAGRSRADPLHAIDLNIPSINAPVDAGPDHHHADAPERDRQEAVGHCPLGDAEPARRSPSARSRSPSRPVAAAP